MGIAFGIIIVLLILLVIIKNKQHIDNLENLKEAFNKSKTSMNDEISRLYSRIEKEIETRVTKPIKKTINK